MQSLTLFNQTFKTTTDSTANVNEKTFTVPDKKRWIVSSIYVEYTATAGGNARQLEVDIQSSGGDVLIQAARAGATQAGGTTRYYTFASGCSDLTSMRDSDFLTTPLPAPLELESGEVLRVFDNVDEDETDDMIVHLRYYEQHNI